MNKFKQGDRVVFVKDGDYVDIEMPKGTRGTYDDDGPTTGAPYVLLDSGERVRARRDHIAHAEDHGTGDGSASDICAEPGCNCDLERRFPAPLDPAKVAITLKGGDYIEAESDGTKIGGKVSHVTERGFVAIEHLGLFAVHHITPSPLPEGYRMFVLTAHTPAPEPEPYVPDLEHIRSAYVSARHDNDIITSQEAEAEFDRWMATRAVIDPADVDLVALTKIGDEAYLTDQSEFRHDGIQAAILAALAHLGIEVPR